MQASQPGKTLEGQPKAQWQHQKCTEASFNRGWLQQLACLYRMQIEQLDSTFAKGTVTCVLVARRINYFLAWKNEPVKSAGRNLLNHGRNSGGMIGIAYGYLIRIKGPDKYL
ncbi:hypothetical protein HYFRA_00009217 [Hymenoscyphus fraxineus]|uniref:Uncharacterized protein n=1 Tax=Hymenoscyphus fraxineus TaxID=746836 RepID=A0A9N9PT42_9HELO|nr:hypothetical protein HYFRA_00009217 [Hymenoscyphus fraxineus]